MNNAVALVPDPGMLRDGLQQDIVHAVIVGSIGKMVTAPGGGHAVPPKPAPRRSRPSWTGC